MRETAYRLWDKRFKKMYPVSSLMWARNTEPQRRDPFSDKKTEYIEYVVCGGIWYAAENGYELMQYIGLKDKNGVKIFKGDIIKKSYKNGFCYLVIEYFKYTLVARLIKYMEYEYVIGLNYRDDLEFYDLYQIENYDLKIIGNKYENPELLNPNKKEL